MRRCEHCPVEQCAKIEVFFLTQQGLAALDLSDNCQLPQQCKRSILWTPITSILRRSKRVRAAHVKADESLFLRGQNGLAGFSVASAPHFLAILLVSRKNIKRFDTPVSSL